MPQVSNNSVKLFGLPSIMEMTGISRSGVHSLTQQPKSRPCHHSH